MERISKCTKKKANNPIGKWKDMTNYLPEDKIWMTNTYKRYWSSINIQKQKLKCQWNAILYKLAKL